ncbi:glutathione transferase GstA [Tabrizicola sp. BL-A-41-H6]|uniref:glutathione transferase GstA n=1 Tax=Tabrizicola sp. BL-A-41-H6 TaxID=3421107 RepID=UPI003D674149
MKLYYTPGTCSLACHIALHDAGTPFSAERVDLRAKTTADGSDFRKANPKGSVPALEIEPGVVLTEGVAIMQYVADSVGGAGVAPAVGTLERARMQEAMNFIGGELHKTGYGPLFRPGLSDEARQAQFAVIDAKLSWIEGLLADGREYLVTTGYTLADGYLFTISGWSKGMGHDLSRFPLIVALRERVAERPAVQAAMKAEGML